MRQLCAFLASCLLAACNPAGDAGPTLKEQALLPETGVIAVVDGALIGAEIFNERYRWFPQTADLGKVLSLKLAIGHELIDQQLLEQAARQRQIVITDADIEAAFGVLAASFPDTASYDRHLAQVSGGAPRLRVALHTRLLQDRLAGAADLMIDDAQARAWYDSHPHLYKRPETRFVQEIRLRLPPGATPEERARLRAQAGLILKKTVTEPFEALARGYSDAPQARNGGYRGGLTRANSEPAVWAGLERLAPGELSAVIESAQGFHIFKLLKRGSPRTQSFEQVRDRIKQQLAVQQRSTAVSALLVELRGAARIENELERRYAVLLAATAADNRYADQKLPVGSLVDQPLSRYGHAAAAEIPAKPGIMPLPETGSAQ